MAKDSLISLGGNLEDPRNAKPSDFPAVGPTGAAGEASGAGQLVKQSAAQIDLNSVMPSSFSVQKAKANSTSIKCDWGVDLESGQVTPDIVKYPA